MLNFNFNCLICFFIARINLFLINLQIKTVIYDHLIEFNFYNFISLLISLMLNLLIFYSFFHIIKNVVEQVFKYIQSNFQSMNVE